MHGRAGLTLVEALIVFTVLCGLWWAPVPDLLRARKPNRTGRCSARLLGLAAVQYADGTRYFPHIHGAGAGDAAEVRDDADLALWWRVEAPCALLALLLGAVLVSRRGGAEG